VEKLFSGCGVSARFRGDDECRTDADAGAVMVEVVVAGGGSGGGSLLPDGYRLEVSERGDVRVQAIGGRGVFYAFQTLAQIFRKFGTEVPCLVCEDWPDLVVRGFMLDISRCKVPTMETLFALVEQLAALRINQLQLYTEHTFAFPGHDVVWRDASPMTTAEIEELVGYCGGFGIALVPNLQSFGHMERWLKHGRYRHLAECPDGFYHELAGAHRPASTLRPNAESLAFVDGLYGAYLPAFGGGEGGKFFNIGGDEPWELGLGWSRPLCEAQGRHAVYREHLAGLVRLAERRGARVQFWADILLEDPGHAGEVPEEAVPVLWGYDAGHPFDTQCAVLEKLGREYLVAPGASAWQTFHGRVDNALANVCEAVDAALRHRARGILLTSWGDNGNHQPWWAFYPALAGAAALAWNYGIYSAVVHPDSEEFAGVIAGVFFEGKLSSARRVLAHGKTDAVFRKQIRNKSVLWELLLAPVAVLTGTARVPVPGAGAVPETTAAGAVAAAGLLGAVSDAEIVAALEREAAVGAEAGDIEGEAALALGRLAGARVRLIRSGGSVSAYRAQLREAVALYMAAWRLRAREGGLAESVARIEASAEA
jgi:hypothetical protein